MGTLSIIIPVFNEAKNISPLYRKIILLGRILRYNLEIIFINDGSTDSSETEIRKLVRYDRKVKIINFTKNFGQTAAFDAGIKAASGEIIATMDADLQNDPEDIRLLLNKLKQGYDVVCGWRKNRKDSSSKKFFSFLANFLRRHLTGEKIHDSGCSLRVYRREVLADVDLYGEMHRFIPAILALKGYKISEVVVNHKPRLYGKSKYGLARLGKGLFDLFFIVFLLKFAARPLHVFGTLGAVISFLGFIMGIYLTFLKIFFNATLSNRPLLILAVLLIVLGTQFFIFGILAEIITRIYFKTHSLKPYTIRGS